MLWSWPLNRLNGASSRDPPCASTGLSFAPNLWASSLVVKPVPMAGGNAPRLPSAWSACSVVK